MTKTYQFFRWFPADAETDEKYAALSLEELGLFHRCLNHAWMNDGLPGTAEGIASVLRVDAKRFSKLWAKVGEMFYLTETVRPRHVNKRLEEEREHALAKSASASKSVGVREHLRRVRSSNDTSNDHLRASESASVSVSASSGDARGAVEWRGGGNAAAQEWPALAAAIRGYFPAADDGLVMAVVHDSMREFVDVLDGDPRHKLTDDVLATAAHEAYFAKQQSAGMFKSRIPRCIRTWAEQVKGQSTR